MKRSLENRKAMIRCLQDESGETLVESLVSILVSSLALIMLATAISSAVNIVLNSKDYMSKYYSDESKLIENAVGTPGLSENELSIEVPLNMTIEDGTVKPVEVSVTVYRDTGDGGTGIVYYERTQQP